LVIYNAQRKAILIVETKCRRRQIRAWCIGEYISVSGVHVLPIAGMSEANVFIDWITPDILEEHLGKHKGGLMVS
jgi:hypothetical protein